MKTPMLRPLLQTPELGSFDAWGLFSSAPQGKMTVEHDPTSAQRIQEARIDPQLANASVEELNEALSRAFQQEAAKDRSIFDRSTSGG
jgi:hypothetical protein